MNKNERQRQSRQTEIVSQTAAKTRERKSASPDDLRLSQDLIQKPHYGEIYAAQRTDSKPKAPNSEPARIHGREDIYCNPRSI